MISDTLQTIIQWILAIVVAFTFWHFAMRVYEAYQKPGNPINIIVNHLTNEA